MADAMMSDINRCSTRASLRCCSIPRAARGGADRAPRLLVVAVALSRAHVDAGTQSELDRSRIRRLQLPTSAFVPRDSPAPEPAETQATHRERRGPARVHR